MKSCPKCKIQLEPKAIGPVEVDECERCKGVWFDKDELRQAKDITDSDLNWMDFEIWKHPEKFKPLTKSYDCPSCGNSMNVIDYDNTKVEIDYCKNCRGIWLDKNKLKKIIQALEEEILTKSMDEYVKSTIEEAKELLTGPESFLSEWKDFTTILRFLQYRILSQHPKISDALVNIQKNPLNR